MSDTPIYYKTLDEAIKAIKEDGRRIKYCSPELKENKDLCLLAVKQNGLAIQYLPFYQKSNPNIMVEAVKENSFAIFLISDSLEYWKKNLPEEKYEKLDTIISVNLLKNDPNFIDHASPIYSETMRDVKWENRAYRDFKTYKNLKKWQAEGRQDTSLTAKKSEKATLEM